MRHYYEIVGYNKDEDCHICKDSSGEEHLIDIEIYSKIVSQENYKSEDMIGKHFSCSHVVPYVSIAHDVKIEN